MQVSITIDDEGEGVSVQGQQEDPATREGKPDFESMSGENLSAGRAATGGAAGFDPAGLGPATAQPEGLPSQRGVAESSSGHPQAMGSATDVPAGVSAGPATQGTIPHQAQSYPIQPAQRQTLAEGEIFLGNEF